MRKIVMAGAGLVLLLSGCATGGSDDAGEPGDNGASDLLAGHGLDDMDVTEIIDHLDRVPIDERSTTLMASVQPDELQLSDESAELGLDLPEDTSYISIAPFVDQSHECFYHSLTTCLGELSGEAVDVTITDSATGEEVVDETATTFDNGFVGFWVPRGITGTVEISSGGRDGTADFSTKDDGATCITGLRLT
ncbi:hypothetical protein FO013_19940 [Brevibacterium aurantiacum]|uniref:CueP family metal-binding protein n=2 Tax=Brevibacterium aurantiacum TaxID=273384 RepID=A0A556C522_BREAU|nr:hypothetical protein FO013_19940 [Brevibacterium aurantiacum]